MAFDLKVVLEAQNQAFISSMNQATDAINKFAANASKASDPADRLQKSMSGMSFGAFVAGANVAVASLSNLAHGFESFTENLINNNAKIQDTILLMKGLSTATGDMAKTLDAKDQYEYVMRLGTQAPFSIDALTKAFVQLKTGGIDPTKGAMQGIVDAVASFGGDDQRLLRATYAIQEMLGRGVLSLSNLRRQLGQDIPGAEKAMADALGVSLPVMFKMVETGSIASEDAIRRMVIQLERLYGGSAQNMMDTYRGRLQQLQTTFMNLSQLSMGQHIGATANSGNVTQPISAFKTLTDSMAQFNQQLQSPAVSGAAVTLNEQFAGLFQTITRFLQMLSAHSETILSFGTAMAKWGSYAAGALLVWKSLSALTTVFGALGGGVKTIYELATGLKALTDVAMLARLATLATSLEAVGAALLAVNPSTWAIAGGALAIAGIMTTIHLLTRDTQALKLAADSANDSMRRLREGSFSDADISGARTEQKNNGDRLDVARRLLDYSQRAQNGGLSGRDQRAFENLAQRFHHLGSIEGGPALDLTGMAGSIGRGNDWATRSSFQNYVNQLREYTTRGSGVVSDEDSTVQQAMQQHGAYDVRNEIANAEKELNAFRSRQATVYRGQMAGIRRDRDNLSVSDFAANSPGNLAIDDRKTAIDNTFDQQEIKKTEELYSTLLKQKEDYIKKGDDITAAGYDSELKGLQQHIEELNSRLQTAPGQSNPLHNGNWENDHPNIDPGNAHAYQKEFRSAQSQMQTMEQRGRQLEARFNDIMQNIVSDGDVDRVTTNLERINAALGNGGRLAEVTTQNKAFADQLRDAARAEDEWLTKIKQATEVENAIKRMGSAYESAAAQVKEFAIRLSDPTMSDAQVNEVLNEQRTEDAVAKARLQYDQAIATLDKVTQAYGRLDNAADKAQQAQYAAAVAAKNAAAQSLDAITAEQKKLKDEQTTADLERDALAARQKANQNRLNSLSPADAARERHRQDVQNIQGSINRAQNVLNDPNASAQARKAALQDIAQENELMATSSERMYARISSAGAQAAKQGDSFADQLREKISQLQAKMDGADPSIAKFNQRLADIEKNHGTNLNAEREVAAYRQVEQAAKDYGDMMKAVKKESDAEGNATSYDDMMATGSGLDKLSAKLQKVTSDSNHAYAAAQRVLRDTGATPAARSQAQQMIASHGNLAQNRDEVLWEGMQHDFASLGKDKDFGETLNEQLAAVKEHYAQYLAAVKNFAKEKNLTEEQSSALTAKINQSETAATLATYRNHETQTQQMFDQWGKSGQAMDQGLNQTFSSISESFGRLAATGKASFQNIEESFVKMITDVVLKFTMSHVVQMIEMLVDSRNAMGDSGAFSANTGTGALSGILGDSGFSKWLGGALGIGGGSESDAFAGFSDTVAFHTGGIVGSESPMTRNVNHAIFNGAPKYHTGGLAGDEMPAILRKGEGVFTEGQMRALGSALKPPSDIGSGSNYNNGYKFSNPASKIGSSNTGSSQSQGNVTIHLHNQSGQQLTATSSAPKFDAEGMVLNTVVKAMNRPGSLRTAMKNSGSSS